MFANLDSAVECAPDQDLELVEGSKRGDVGAFEKIVRRYDRKLLRIAQNVTQNFEEAQEVVQIAFLKAFQSLDRFQGDAKFSTWLIRIVLNESLMRMGAQQGVQEECAESNLYGEDKDSIAGGEFAMNVVDWDTRLEMLYSKVELREILTKSLRNLPPTLRLIFVLRDIDGHSIAETAEILGLTPGAVQTRISRARMQLRQELNPYFKV